MRVRRFAAGVFLCGVLAAGLASAWNSNDEAGRVQAGNHVLGPLGVQVYEAPGDSFGVQATPGRRLSEVTVVYPEIDPGSTPGATQ